MGVDFSGEECVKYYQMCEEKRATKISAFTKNENNKRLKLYYTFNL